MTPLTPVGQIRIVLSWPSAPSDLDLFSSFKTSPNTFCSVYFGKKYCSGVNLNVDNNLGGRKGAETITIQLVENFVYSLSARKYVDETDNGRLKGEISVKGAPEINHKTPEKFENVNMDQSKAKISLYVSNYEFSLFDIHIPDNVGNDNLLYPNEDKNNSEKDINWWLAFCLNGSQGIDSVKIVNKLTSKQPDFTYCEEFYRQRKEEANENSTDINEKIIKKPAFIEFEVDDNNWIRKVNHFLKKPERF